MDTLELGLKGKVAIITGGSEGLGRAAAERLAREGVRVGICARRKDVLERALDDIRKATGAEILPVVADVSQAAGCDSVVAAAIRQFGAVDILLNNAGTSAGAGFEQVSDEAWHADLELKLMAAVRMCRLVIPHMKRHGGGRMSGTEALVSLRGVSTHFTDRSSWVKRLAGRPIEAVVPGVALDFSALAHKYAFMVLWNGADDEDHGGST